jgi:protein TonB
MKIPFSYKVDTFKIFVAGSIVLHLSIAGLLSFLPDTPEFTVEQGENSLEIVIREEPSVQEVKQPEIEPLDTITANVGEVEIPVVPQVDKIVIEDKKNIKEWDKTFEVKRPSRNKQAALQTKANQGAVIEAKPFQGVRNPAPKYPVLARRRGWEGSIELKVLVRQDGFPDEVVIQKSSGYKILDDSAITTVQAWEFTAARRGIMKFDSWITVPITFQLTE